MSDYEAFESGAPTQIEKMLLAPTDMDSAVVSRSTIKVRPQGSSTYNNASRTMQFRLSSSDYADLSTLKWGFKMSRARNSQIPEDLYALTAIQDIRVEVGGVVAEDIRNVNRCIKPLIYAGVDAEYLKSDLTMSGSYKYVPSHCGLLAANTSAYQLNGLSLSGATDAKVAGDIVASQMTFDGSIAGLASGADVAACRVAINKILAQRYNSPYSVYLAHPATGSTATQGLDLGTAGVKVPANAGLTRTTNNTSYNNYTSLNVIGGAVRRNSMPIWDAADESHEGDINQAGDRSGLTRDYTLPMKLVLGLCRIDSYFVLRNAGSLLIEITLSDYKQQFIHTVPPVQDDEVNYTSVTVSSSDLAGEIAKLEANTSYSITNPYMQYDVVKCSDAVVSRIDELCSSAQGYRVPFETYSSITTPFQYTTHLSLTYSRAFSKLKDVYVAFQQQESANSLYLSKSDYYMGSRYISHNLQVGSTNFPVVDCDSASEAYGALQHTFSHLGTSKGTVIDRKTWLGQRADFACNQFSQAGLMPDIVVANAGGEAAHRMSSALHTQAPSCALWGQSLERVLSKSGATYGSGISTRASGMQLTHNFQFKEFVDEDWRSKKDSIMSPKFLDAHLGSSRMLAYTTFHIDSVLTFSSDAVSCSS